MFWYRGGASRPGLAGVEAAVDVDPGGAGSAPWEQAHRPSGRCSSARAPHRAPGGPNGFPMTLPAPAGDPPGVSNQSRPSPKRPTATAKGKAAGRWAEQADELTSVPGRRWGGSSGPLSVRFPSGRRPVSGTFGRGEEPGQPGGEVVELVGGPLVGPAGEPPMGCRRRRRRSRRAGRRAGGRRGAGQPGSSGSSGRPPAPLLAPADDLLQRERPSPERRGRGPPPPGRGSRAMPTTMSAPATRSGRSCANGGPEVSSPRSAITAHAVVGGRSPVEQQAGRRHAGLDAGVVEPPAEQGGGHRRTAGVPGAEHEDLDGGMLGAGRPRSSPGITPRGRRLRRSQRTGAGEAPSLGSMCGVVAVLRRRSTVAPPAPAGWRPAIDATLATLAPGPPGWPTPPPASKCSTGGSGARPAVRGTGDPPPTLAGHLEATMAEARADDRRAGGRPRRPSACR